MDLNLKYVKFKKNYYINVLIIIFIIRLVECLSIRILINIIITLKIRQRVYNLPGTTITLI